MVKPRAASGLIAYPLAELLATIKDYLQAAPRDFVTFEYVMLDGVNDSVQHAHELAKLVSGIECKFNLIPWNPFPDAPYARSSNNAIHRFRDVLQQAGLIVTVRKTRGDDIDAACGQLAGQVVDKSHRTQQNNCGSSNPSRTIPIINAGLTV